MINQEQTIPCPVCNTKIPFTASQLLQGVQFKCPNEECNASISLSKESKPIVENTMNKLDEVKGIIGKK